VCKLGSEPGFMKKKFDKLTREFAKECKDMFEKLKLVLEVRASSSSFVIEINYPLCCLVQSA
jgi:hypothetical protein